MLRNRLEMLFFFSIGMFDKRISRAWISALLVGMWSIITSHGQTLWRSSLYPVTWQPPSASVSFANAKLIQDFSYAGYRRGEAFLPSISGPVFDVTSYGADASGTNNSTVAIQNAINAASAAGGGVVYLPAGIYRVSPQGTDDFALRISTSNIVLRGAGVSQSMIVNTTRTMRNGAVIQVSPQSTSLGTVRIITADLPGPTHRIPVENSGSFSVGNVVRLQWSFTNEWVAENGQGEWWGAAKPSAAIYYRQVTAVNDVEGWIELDVPTRYWIKTRDNPSVRTISGLIREVGIESLGIANLQNNSSGWAENDYLDGTKAAYDVHNSWLIRFQHVRDGWIANVRSQDPGNSRTCHMLSNGILLSNCMRVTLLNCQMRRTQYGGGGGNGYMYRLQNSNECLLRGCLADVSRHGYVISHAGTSGNVFLQCEDRETARAIGSYSNNATYTTSGSGSDNHMHFSHSNLWDQCHVHNSFFTAHHRGGSGSAPTHGLTSAHAVYWNISGSGSRYADSSNPIVRSEQLNYGYIIGTRSTDGTNSYFTSRNTGGNTAPQDHQEGASNGSNTGAGLQPQSLYLDQISRRLRPVVVFHGVGGSEAAPKQVNFGETYGALPESRRSGYTFQGWFSAASGGSQVTADTVVSNSSDHELFARWNAWPTAHAGPDQDLARTLPVEWTPQYLATAAWYDASDPGSMNVINNTVSQWRDKSGHSNHANQSNSNRRPAIGSAASGGLNVVVFDPFKDQHLVASHHASLHLDGSGGANLFAVFRTSGYVSRGSGLNSIVSKGALLTADSAYGIRVNDNGRLPFKAGSSFMISPADAYLSKDILYGATRNDRYRTAKLFIDGVELAESSAASILSNNTNALVLGGETTTSRCAAVHLGEVLVVPGELSVETRQTLEGYLSKKWSLPTKLPIGHPFRSAAPSFVATTALAGSVVDQENDPWSSSWSMISGPAPVAFRQASATYTQAYFPIPGRYVLRLSATDGTGETNDDLTIIVADFANPFVLWNGASASDFLLDKNADGLADGLAWLLGAASPDVSASQLLPIARRENGALAITFRYLDPGARAGYSMRLQHSSTLVEGSWTDVEIPDSSGTVGGVEFVIMPLENGRLREVKAIVPATAARRIFVRIASTDPGGS